MVTVWVASLNRSGEFWCLNKAICCCVVRRSEFSVCTRVASPALKTKGTINAVLAHCPLTLSGPHIWRCKRACHVRMRLTGRWLRTELVGFSRPDADRAPMSKKCISRTRKYSKCGRRFFWRRGRFWKRGLKIKTPWPRSIIPH